MKKLLLFGAAVFSLAAAVDYTAEGDAWWAHIRFLADDALQGRDTGSEGYHKAVQYVATKMEQFGLRAAGSDGYLQPVNFETRELVPAESSLALVRDGNEQKLSPAEATMNARADAGTVEAPMVFAGYGLRIPEAHYDELAGLDLKGRIVVYVNAPGPVDAPGPVKSHAGSAAERWETLRAAGAIGVAIIMNPRAPAVTGQPPTNGSGPAAGRGARGGAAGMGAAGRGPQKVFLLADPALQEQAGQKVALTITRAGGEKFFIGSGHTYDEILALARDNRPLPKFPLAGTLRATTVVRTEKLEAPNLAGILPGSDPGLKNQYVILSAHLDHVGVGRPVNGDAIYNGAMDDASGIASILEIARIMKAEAMKPRRSVVFLAVTAEEKGELGSRYFAMHPTVPAKDIVADINLDMFMPLFDLKFVEVQGLGESTLGDNVREAAEPFGVTVQADKEPEQNRFIRSDQYSFIRNGVPSLAFKFGYEFGTPEDKIFHDWIRDRYHKPSDDLDQPVDKAAAAKFDRLIASLLMKVADADAKPAWKSDSFFRRFAK
ncbi:MAG: M20/M25/M40 family metallo-hydrolase [Acidobacteria bacterium]|nr:M20/M25/M40 family metallo-hydrolase [Acidobacteriota bacterium]